jgi:hypothetical protein
MIGTGFDQSAQKEIFRGTTKKRGNMTNVVGHDNTMPSPTINRGIMTRHNIRKSRKVGGK